MFWWVIVRATIWLHSCICFVWCMVVWLAPWLPNYLPLKTNHYRWSHPLWVAKIWQLPVLIPQWKNPTPIRRMDHKTLLVQAQPLEPLRSPHHFRGNSTISSDSISVSAWLSDLFNQCTSLPSQRHLLSANDQVSVFSFTGVCVLFPSNFLFPSLDKGYCSYIYIYVGSRSFPLPIGMCWQTQCHQNLLLWCSSMPIIQKHGGLGNVAFGDARYILENVKRVKYMLAYESYTHYVCIWKMRPKGHGW